jgi:hypothetical protein
LAYKVKEDPLSEKMMEEPSSEEIIAIEKRAKLAFFTSIVVLIITIIMALAYGIMLQSNQDLSLEIVKTIERGALVQWQIANGTIELYNITYDHEMRLQTIEDYLKNSTKNDEQK